MDYKMRRFRQLLPEEETLDILKNGTNGVLALCGSDGEPYAVPISYVYAHGKLYFHGAGVGHKHDIIKENPRASFAVVRQDEIVPEKFTTYFKSVIAFGTIKYAETREEIRRGIELLAKKYSPLETDEAVQAEIAASGKGMRVFVLEIEKITGKQAIELVNKK